MREADQRVDVDGDELMFAFGVSLTDSAVGAESRIVDQGADIAPVDRDVS